MYYAFIENNQINGCGQCPVLNEEILNYEITEEIYNNIQDYIWNGEAVVIDPDLDEKQLNEAKENKIAVNDIARDNALVQGVTYKNVLFDSDTDQKVNLLATVETMPDDKTIVWFGKDNQPLTCTKEDLFNIGGLITQLHSFCWNKNALIKQAINSAATIEEVEAIDIDYTESEGENGI